MTGSDRKSPYAGLATILNDFVQMTQGFKRDYSDYFDLRDRFSIELANLLCDIAECDRNQDFFKIDLRSRIAELGRLADIIQSQDEPMPPDTPYPGAYPGAPLAQTPMREMLARADQGYADDPRYSPPADPRYQAPAPYHPGEFAHYAPPPNAPAGRPVPRQPINGR